MALQLIGTLEACGLSVMPLGATFIADHSQSNGTITETWIDHVYFSADLKSGITSNIVNFGSSDHLPVTSLISATVTRKNYKRKILKRKMKNFTNQRWNEVIFVWSE